MPGWPRNDPHGCTGSDPDLCHIRRGLWNSQHKVMRCGAIFDTRGGRALWSRLSCYALIHRPGIFRYVMPAPAIKCAVASRTRDRKQPRQPFRSRYCWKGGPSLSSFASVTKALLAATGARLAIPWLRSMMKSIEFRLPSSAPHTGGRRQCCML